jgi:hypothetical protein
MECINYETDINSLPQMNNLNVQVDDKIDLINGYIVYIKKNNRLKIYMFLPKMTVFYTMKIAKK